MGVDKKQVREFPLADVRTEFIILMIMSINPIIGREDLFKSPAIYERLTLAMLREITVFLAKYTKDEV